MAAITVNTNGQTLTVNASVSHWTTAALAVAASAANDVESTTTTTITSNYTMHFSDSATTAVITVKQADRDTTLYTGTLDVSPGTGPRTLNPLPDQYQMAADQTDVVKDRMAVADGQESYSRYNVISGSVITMTSQRLILTGLVADTTREVTSMRWITGATAAGATPSLVRAGIYTAAADGAIALVASTTSDTALMGTLNTAVTKALTTPYTLTKGQRYMFGLLVVTAATAPTVFGYSPHGGVASEAGALPKVCGFISSQADLPASASAATLGNAGTLNPYMVGVYT